MDNPILDTPGPETQPKWWKKLVFLAPPWGPEWVQNVAQKTSFRTPKYRPNPASGGPIGGKSGFLKKRRSQLFWAPTIQTGG